MRTTLLVLAALLLPGCGGEFKLAPVSGTVTMDGQPLVGVEVAFAPMESSENPNPGPVAFGTTDAEGIYTLHLQDGKIGAVVARHRVGISFGEIDESVIAARVDAAFQKNSNLLQEEVNRIERQAERELRKSRSIPASYNQNSTLEFDVPGAGTTVANFELKSDGS